MSPLFCWNYQRDFIFLDEFGDDVSGSCTETDYKDGKNFIGIDVYYLR